jgi:hypothetical protein
VPLVVSSGRGAARAVSNATGAARAVSNATGSGTLATNEPGRRSDLTERSAFTLIDLESATDGGASAHQYREPLRPAPDHRAVRSGPCRRS